MNIQAVEKSDIPTIMAIERTDGYDRLVGRWDAEQHGRELESPSTRYLMARIGADVAAFAILQDVGSANRCVRLRRIAVREAGRGVGSQFLKAVLDTCFDALGARRVELQVHMENERARRVYAKTGFAEEGILRDFHREADGSFRSMRQMSLLAPEWTVRRPEKAPCLSGQAE